MDSEARAARFYEDRAGLAGLSAPAEPEKVALVLELAAHIAQAKQHTKAYHLLLIQGSQVAFTNTTALSEYREASERNVERLADVRAVDAIGAIHLAAARVGRSAYEACSLARKARILVEERELEGEQMPFWNDAPGIGQADVVRVLERGAYAAAAPSQAVAA